MAWIWAVVASARGAAAAFELAEGYRSCLFLRALLAALAKELPVGVALGDVVKGGTGRGSDLLQGAW
ncbi:MAG: hypothetical protein ACI90Z_002282 [Cyanobium sp.]|jgi:hypothetical protein